MKILINTPRLIPHGGVANHYIGLKEYWTEDVVYNPVGKKGNKSGSGIYRLPMNVLEFIRKIFSFNPDIILLNPSLSKGAMTRDMIFLRIAKMFGKKVVVFIHGFDKDNIKSLDIKRITKNLNKCEAILILAQEFADIVRSWGVTVPIHLTTTKVDDKLVEGFDIANKSYKLNTILFLARVTKAKGIFTALDTFKILQMKYPDIQIRIVGTGEALEEAKEYSTKENIQSTCFLGALSGEKLVNEYSNADIYILPTTHGEGMPTSILEAMAFGLPVISRPVGGTCDFFENGKMGQLIESLNPEEYAAAIENYINNEQLLKDTAVLNHNYAKKHFMASSVAKKIEEILGLYVR
ncbi:MAG: glycosyltransferase family 4 protein [Bacteroidaceae bacterium]|nr:glycosyltransferase family 4 protein [Bacteroidaceae bacterium]